MQEGSSGSRPFLNPEPLNPELLNLPTFALYFDIFVDPELIAVCTKQAQCASCAPCPGMYNAGSGTSQCEDAYYNKASHCTMQHGMHYYSQSSCSLGGCDLAPAVSQCRRDGYTSPESCCTEGNGYYGTAPTCKYLQACVVKFSSKGYDCYDATCAARVLRYGCRRC